MLGSARSHRTTVLCLVLLALVTVLFFHRVLLHPGATLNTGDLGNAHSEYKYVQWRSFADWGRFPLWDPTIFCGKSIVGDSLPAVLNVPQWLFWITPSPVFFGYILWFYATLGAWGMFFFAKKRGCDPQGAMIAAVVFALGGKVAGHLYAGHLEVLATTFCLPWIMLAAEGALEKPSLLRACLLGAALALAATCGSVQIMYWHFLFVGAYALLWLLSGLFQRRGMRATFWSALAFAAGMLSFLVFAAPWWLPIFTQTLMLSGRAQGTGYSLAASFSPQYADLLHLLWPFHEITPPAWPAEGKGIQVFWEKTLYMGVIPLTLLVPACLLPGKHRASVVILAVLTTLTFLLALGSSGPLLGLAVRCIPGFGFFRCPGRLFFYTAFLAALLVGLFVSDGGSTLKKRMVLAVSGLMLAAVIVGAFLLWRTEGEWTARAGLPIALLVLFVPLALLWMRGTLPDRLWKASVLLLVCADLFVIWNGHIVVQKTEIAVQGTPVGEFLAGQKRDEEFRFLAPEALLNQTRAARYGLEMVAGYHPGIYGRYLDLYKAIWKSDDSTTTLLKEHSPQDVAHPVLLDLMNVVFTVVAPADPGVEGATAVEIAARDGGPLLAKAYRRDSALPRVCIVPGADLPAPGTTLLDALCSIDPKAGCLVEDRPFKGGDAFRPLPFERQSPSDLTVRFKSEKGGVVLISQAWHPDWKATDNGQLVEVRRVNYDFVGVCVTPGDHEIRVWYLPMDFYLGCYIAVLGWTMLAVLGAWTLRGKRRTAKLA